MHDSDSVKFLQNLKLSSVSSYIPINCAATVIIKALSTVTMGIICLSTLTESVT